MLESGNGEMTWQYVLILLAVVAGAIAAGAAIGCSTLREWSWMALVSVLIFLGIAALFAVVNPRVPGNIRSRSSAIPRPPGILRARWHREPTPA